MDLIDHVAALVLLLMRIWSSISSPILDCDETYNYWEPLHLLLTTSSSFQTWEYSPEFALRSWTFLLPYAFIGHLLSAAGQSTRTTFYALRGASALLCAFVEIRLARTLASFQISPNMFLLLQATSPGMFHSAPALLPSTFAMIGTFVALDGWAAHTKHLHGNVSNKLRAIMQVVIAHASSTLLAWPFSGVLAIPYSLWCLANRRDGLSNFMHLFRAALPTVCTLAGLLIVVDSYFYGKLVFVPWNMINYNVVRNRSALYGVEPWSFYAKNLVLNWTFAAPLALLSAIYSLVRVSFRTSVNILWRGSSLMLIIWIAIFITQPHKEERFMTPIYPIIGLLASLLLVRAQLFAPSWCKWLVPLLKFTTCALGLLRICGLIQYYGAPTAIDIPLDVNGTICLGNDWHLTPGHFILPNQAQLSFVQQQFSGHLPHKFALVPDAALKNMVRATSAFRPSLFNDDNRASPSQFIPIEQCDHVLGRDQIHTDFKQTKTCLPMLHGESSPIWARVLYLPKSALGKYQSWQMYCLWSRKIEQHQLLGKSTNA